jgi:hypothetical protein
MMKAPDSSEASVAPQMADDASPAAAVAAPQCVRPAAVRPQEADARIGASIHAIDTVLKLEPGRTERSSCYLEALARLSDGGRVCVERMETLMFAQKLRVRDCGHGGLHLPNAVFECPQGRIWYHFSLKHRKFVLSFFHIDGRNGGLPIPVPVPCLGGTGTASNDDWAGGIAARIASYLKHSRNARAIGLSLTAFPPVTAIVQTAWCFWGEHSSRGLLDDIVRADCAMMNLNDEATLPDSSLLAGSILVGQQLQNPFARAIVVGEVTCRLGTELGDRVDRCALRWGPVLNRTAGTTGSTVPPDRLLAESTAIIEAVANNSMTGTLRETVRHFLTASLMDPEMMLDGLRLELVRSELIYRLAVNLAAEVDTSAHACLCVDERSEQQAVLMRKYALLSEFVSLSSEFFDTGSRIGVGSEDLLLDMTAWGRRDRTVMKRLARCLLDFSASTFLVVNHFSLPTDIDRNVRDRLDQAGMSSRLSSIAAEIFDVSVAREDAVH